MGRHAHANRSFKLHADFRSSDIQRSLQSQRKLLPLSRICGIPVYTQVVRTADPNSLFPRVDHAP
jgi:hypothetical protein